MLVYKSLVYYWYYNIHSKTCYNRLLTAGPTDERYVTGGGVRAGVTLCDRGRSKLAKKALRNR